MSGFLETMIPKSGWDWLNWASTLLFLAITVWTFLVVRRLYVHAARGIEVLREKYDSIVRRAQADAESTLSALAEQEKIEMDDTLALLARRAGVGRKMKLHDALRRDRELLRAQLEEARTRTESLPLIGILGTILGLVLASMGQESLAAITSGIWIALSSSLFALFVMLVVKYRWEFEVLSDLENLEDRESLVFEYVALREDADIASLRKSGP